MRRVLVVAAAVLLVAAVAGGLLWWRSQPSGELERAVALAPADAERLTWTDWRGVRAQLGVELDEASSPGELTALLDAGYEADLTSTSALLGSAEAMQAEYGVSPATLDWELFSQSAAGAVVLMRLADGTDLGELRDGLAALGYQRPDEDDGVWFGGADLLAGTAPGLTPQLQHLAIDDDERLLLASDSDSYLAGVVDELGEGAPEALAPVVEAAGEAPLTAVVYDAAYACGALAMSQAGESDQRQAEQLLAEAGEVDPLTGFLLAELPDGTLRLAMSFETEEQARTNADSRSALLRGPAPGQGGDFPDRFTVEEVVADGAVVRAELAPVEGEYVLSDLSAGPVLFATC